MMTLPPQPMMIIGQPMPPPHFMMMPSPQMMMGGAPPMMTMTNPNMIGAPFPGMMEPNPGNLIQVQFK